MRIIQTLPNIRVKWLGDIPKLYCETCGKETMHCYLKSSPMNELVVLALTPFPIPIPTLISFPSSKFEILYVCKKCNSITKVANKSEKKDILSKHKEQNSIFNPYKGTIDLHIWSEVGRPATCDVCYFEKFGTKREFNAPKYVIRHGPVMLCACNKHKNWIKEQKSFEELSKKINQWIELGSLTK